MTKCAVGLAYTASTLLPAWIDWIAPLTVGEPCVVAGRKARGLKALSTSVVTQ